MPAAPAHCEASTLPRCPSSTRRCAGVAPAKRSATRRTTHHALRRPEAAAEGRPPLDVRPGRPEGDVPQVVAAADRARRDLVGVPDRDARIDHEPAPAGAQRALQHDLAREHVRARHRTRGGRRCGTPRCDRRSPPRPIPRRAEETSGRSSWNGDHVRDPHPRVERVHLTARTRNGAIGKRRLDPDEPAFCLSPPRAPRGT